MKTQLAHRYYALGASRKGRRLIRFVSGFVIFVVWGLTLSAFGIGSSSNTSTPRAISLSSTSAHFAYEHPYRLSSGKYVNP